MDPSPEKTCTITEKPPELAQGSNADYGLPGDPGCGEQWETCLSRKAAQHYVALQQWADENYAKCKKDPK